MNTSGEANSVRFTVVAAACLGLVWLGDALIYVVLPLYPAVFGIDTAMVGVLLAVNRIIRILGYGWVATLAHRFGARTLVAVACAAGALSTLAYGLVTGFLLLLIARLVWGAAYGVLNLVNIAYAYGDGRGAGSRIGLNRAVATLGPVAALGAGGWLVTVLGPQWVFVIYGLIGLVAVPLALSLPPLRRDVEDSSAKAERRWAPTPLNILFFTVSLGADGVFTATLSILLADIIPLSAALIGAGLLLAFQRLLMVALALASGRFVDRFGAHRLLAPTCLAIALGLGAIAADQIYVGAILLILARAVFATLAPILAADRAPHDRINAIASYSTWSDTGLAAGPLIGLVALAWIGRGVTYGVLAAAVLLGLAFVRRGPNVLKA